MPTSDQHLLQAGHNYSLLGYLSSKAVDKHYSDWYVTVSFYCSVHIIEAFIFVIGKFEVFSFGSLDILHSSDAEEVYDIKSPHALRKLLIRDNPAYFRSVESDYRSLYEMSRIARYDCDSPQNLDYVEAGQRLEVLRKWGNENLPMPIPNPDWPEQH